MSLANALWLVGLTALPMTARALDEQDAPAKVAPKNQAKPDAAALVKQLGDADYGVRKEAYRKLEKLGTAARAELEKAAQSDDAEVRWSASLLLDRLDGGDRQEFGGRDDAAPTPIPGGPGAPGEKTVRRGGARDDELHRAIEEMHDSIRRMFGERFFDGRMHRFGDEEELFGEQGLFGRLGGMPGQGGELRLGPGSSFSRTFDNDGQRESTSIRVGPDGRVKVEQEKNGEKTSIEAESLEALRKEHPELTDSLGGFGRMEIRVGPLGSPSRTAPGLTAPTPPTPFGPRARARARVERQDDAALAPQTAPAPAPEQDAAPADKPRLGVQVEAVKADVAEYLELEPGVGLEVVRVVAGSAAEKIGMKARDILTEVNGRTIRGVEDVAAALEGKDPAKAEVIVIRRGEEKSLDHREK